MGRRYSISGTATNTQSSTLPLMSVISTAAIRPKIYDVIFSSAGTPADNACLYQFQRCTTTGTVGSAITPQALDPNDPAAVTTAGLAVFSVGPTLTASAFLLQMAHNMRATVRWIAAPLGELVLPATASNGVCVVPVTTTTAFSDTCTIYVEE